MSAQQAILPISELSSYTQKWTIRARVTSKAQLRTFNKGANTGKVFHVNLLDAQGGEIRSSFFNDAADQFFDKLQSGKCYTFSRGSIKIANKQFNPLTHRYELTFDKNAEVVEVEDDSQIDALKFTISDLRSVQSKAVPCSVDLCGVVTEFAPSVSFTSKDGRELIKREVTIADDTAMSLQVTLWGDRAKQDDKCFEGKPVIGLKSVVIKEWQGGRTGSLLEGGALQFKPTFQEAQKVQQWWSQGGSSQALTFLSQTQPGVGGTRSINAKLLNLAQMRGASEALGQETDNFTIFCRLAIVQTRKQGEPQPLSYNACQEPRENSNLKCNRRVDSSGFCASCNRVTNAAPRLNVRCRFADYADSAWITTFHEGAQQVLGMKSEEVQELEKGERDNLEAIVGHTYFNQPLQVTLRAKLETYQGEQRANITCIDAKPAGRGERGRVMLKEIADMLSSMPGDHTYGTAGA